MENFKQSNNPGGRPMYKVVCSKCGKDCEVPFKPTGDKPVFCNDCFRSKRGNEQRRFDSGDKRMYKAICAKCGKECEVPFKPTGDKPVYCKECFNKGDKSKSSGQISSQFEIINAKLDEILKALSPTIKTKISKPKPKRVSKSKVKKAVFPKKTKAKKKK